MWQGRFSGKPDKLMQEFSQSVSFDQRLWREDIQGSLAYAAELQRIGILSAKELADIQRGFKQITDEIESGKFQWKVELEDVHMNIESRLTELIGDAGKKLHTGRSRNDQVSTDFRVWAARRADDLDAAVKALLSQILGRAHETVDVIVPAYTHLQRAMPVRMAHQLLAWFGMIHDGSSFLHAWAQARALSPLGSGACSGNSFGVDMQRLAMRVDGTTEEQIDAAAKSALGLRNIGAFKSAARNSMQAVSDRDFALDLVYACAKCMTHLSRIAEDLILWSTAEFGFVTLGDAVTTGSSIMPQKRNPDACELVRGKTGRVVGHLMSLFTLLKGLPSTYNRDLQEDKEAVFDATDQTLACLRVMALVFSKESFKVNRQRIQQHLDSGAGYMEAMNVADWLVMQGVPFRDGHDITGRLVKYVEQKGMRFADLTAADLAAVDKRLKPELLKELSLEALVERKQVYAGTAKARVLERLAELKEWLK
ncbi:MAG: argininosuccinate lyase [Planctomycetes bacterium]|nr:argininosuccinate lyase [Planctomycetota bacterium]MCW8135523.1 argininosuccinate lyase [Planctomycetota bacterium]